MEELKLELEKRSKAYLDTPEKEEEVLIPFIKRLLERPMKERRKLLPIVRDLQWIKGKFMGYTSETSCKPARARFLAAVQFVCGNKREMDLGYKIDFHLLCRLLPLYCPDWLTDYINDRTSFLGFNIGYEKHMQLIEMGYLKYLTPETVVKLLPQCIDLSSNTPKQRSVYDSSLLLKRDITLKEHIWYLFEYGMGTYTDNCAKEAYKRGKIATDESISAALYRYSLTGQVDRNRLLKATLSTFQRGFKKDLTGYFADLFGELQPTREEILPLQEEMMQIFTSAYTKPVNVMLQYLKTVAAEKEFRYLEFIDRVTPLFFSSPKNSLLTIYATFEQIAELYPDSREACCICLSQLFLKKDEALQKKAANFIIRYGEPGSDALQATLQTYHTEMLQSAQSLLKQIFLKALHNTALNDSTPLLSTPTHTPCYIQATELVQRLSAYQQADKKPLSWDFQLAILRCAIEDKEETLAAAHHLLKGEYLNLITFLFDEHTLPIPPFEQETAWFVAGLLKAPDTEFEAFKLFKCTTESRRYLTGNYTWEAPKKEEYSQFLQIDFNKWTEFLECSSHSLWQEYLDLKSNYNMGDASYMERIFSAFPNLPEPVVAQVIAQYMDFEAPQEESKRVIACALRMLLSFHCPLKEMSLLLLGGSLLFTDKTIRSYAAELWAEGLSSGRIDNQRLGEVLARLLNMDIAPLKRFITQAYESMYKRSTFHNHQLEELIGVMITGLPDKPVTGQKQLLELYLELLNINGSKVKDEKVTERLEVWNTNTNLKRVVTTLTRL